MKCIQWMKQQAFGKLFILFIIEVTTWISHIFMARSWSVSRLLLFLSWNYLIYIFMFSVQFIDHDSIIFFRFLFLLYLVRSNSFLLNGEVQWHSCSISLIRQNVDQANINLNNRNLFSDIAKLILMAICFPLKEKSHFPIYCSLYNILYIFRLSLFCWPERSVWFLHLIQLHTRQGTHERWFKRITSQISNRIVLLEIAGN